jgi:hypothetical protein
MPQLPVRSLPVRSLLERPVDIHQPNLREDPNEIAALINRFFGGLLGDQKPGDLPSAMGSATSLLPLEKILPGAAILASILKKADVNQNAVPLASLLKYGGEGTYALADPAVKRMESALNVGAGRAAEWADTSEVAK